MSRAVAPVVDFYSRHPISEGQIIDALRRQGKDLKRLVPEDLYAFDQESDYQGEETLNKFAAQALPVQVAANAALSVQLEVCNRK